MGYTRLPYGRSSYGFGEFVVDEISDIDDLPTGGTPGSKAVVANAGVEYILNNRHQWVPYSSGGSNSGGETVTQAQINAAIENALASKDLVSNSDLQELTERITTQETINTSQQTDINHFSSVLTYDASQAGKVLAINNEGQVEPYDITAANGVITTNSSGQQVYEVSEHITSQDGLTWLYDLSDPSWASFSLHEGDQVKYQWNKKTYTGPIVADGDNFVLGIPGETNPYIIFKYMEQAGEQILFAELHVQLSQASQIRDYVLTITTGVSEETDNLILRANGYQYRLYIDTNGELQVARIN